MQYLQKKQDLITGQDSEEKSRQGAAFFQRCHSPSAQKHTQALVFTGEILLCREISTEM